MPVLAQFLFTAACIIYGKKKKKKKKKLSSPNLNLFTGVDLFLLNLKQNFIVLT